MANLPRKLTFGSSFKEQTVKTINAIIDYLYSLRLTGDNQTVSITKKKNGITISAKPSPPTKAATAGSGETTINMEEGAAVPCRMNSSTPTNAWELPYYVTVYPNGYGDNTTSVSKYALPTTVGFQPPPPSEEPLICFTNYFLEVGGDSEGGQSAT